jgi:hypothetical protein
MPHPLRPELLPKDDGLFESIPFSPRSKQWTAQPGADADAPAPLRGGRTGVPEDSVLTDLPWPYSGA